MRKNLFVLCCVAASLAGCSASHMDSADVGIVIPDAARSDTGVVAPDGGPAVDAFVATGGIGAPCAADPDCTGAATTCETDPRFFPGGFCTAICDPMDPASCPGGSHCVNIGRTAICLQDCDPGSTTRQCARQGYGCSTNLMLAGVCAAGCFDATDCSTPGQSCDPTGGFLGAGACFAPAAMVGAPCTTATDCPAGGICQSEPGAGWPAGSCLVSPCDAATNTGCPAGDAECITSVTPFGSTDFCIDGCGTTADCRAGYICRAAASHADRLGCFPGCTTDAQCSGGRVCNPGLGTCDDPFDAGQIGQTCSGRDPTTCLGGTCLTEGTTGYPRAYCAYVGCSATTPCPGTGVCAPTADGVGVCLDDCASDSDCRVEYACHPSDGAVPTSPTACVPACRADTDCANMMRAGFVCNVGTGLCGAPFVAATLGEPCASAAECDGGRCFSERTQGWPAGTCTYPGCRLSGAGPAVVCPAGGACVDDGAGSPELGVCVDACTVGTTTCRPGYACVALDGSPTMGACRPACGPTSCAAGRTCNAGTGLCE